MDKQSVVQLYNKTLLPIQKEKTTEHKATWMDLKNAVLNERYKRAYAV